MELGVLGVVVEFCVELGVVPVVVVPGVIVEVGGQGVVVPVEVVVPDGLVVPVVLLIVEVLLVLVLLQSVVEPETLEPGEVIEVPPFWLLLGVVPAEVPLELGVVVELPMPLVEVLGLAEGVATPPEGVVAPPEGVTAPPVGVCGVTAVPVPVVDCPPTAGVVLELLMLPVEVDCGVCPAPAGNVAVPVEDVLPAVPADPGMPAGEPADPAVPVEPVV